MKDEQRIETKESAENPVEFGNYRLGVGEPRSGEISHLYKVLEAKGSGSEVGFSTGVGVKKP